MPDSDPFSVERIAELARLGVPETPEQTEIEISKILQFINVLDELDLKNVEPFFGMKPAATKPEHNPQRSDQVAESFQRDEVLKNAPSHDCEFYRVPPVFE